LLYLNMRTMGIALTKSSKPQKENTYSSRTGALSKKHTHTHTHTHQINIILGRVLQVLSVLLCMDIVEIS